MTTTTDILNQITTGMSVDDIRTLVNTWDMNVGNGTLLLFSGGVGDLVTDGNGQVLKDAFGNPKSKGVRVD